MAKGATRYLAIPSTPRLLEGEFSALEINKKHSNHPRDTYRSIAEENDSDSEDAGSSSSEDGDIALTAEQESMKEIESRLLNAPDDERAWLKLWDLSTGDLSRTTNRTLQARTEISLSILEKAIEAHPNNRQSPRLRLLYIEHGSRVWDYDRIRREWASILSVFGNTQVLAWKRASVWNAWLEWRLGDSSTVKEGLNAVGDVMRWSQGHNFELFRVRICWRLAIFMREAGEQVL